MERFPRLQGETAEEIARVLRQIIILRESDIEESDENRSLNSYDSGFRRSTPATITSAYSAGEDDLDLDVNTSGGSVTVTLLASPYDGQEHRIYKLASTSNTLTVDGNGKNINGAGTYTIGGGSGGIVFLKYMGGAGVWRAGTI